MRMMSKSRHISVDTVYNVRNVRRKLWNMHEFVLLDKVVVETPKSGTQGTTQGLGRKTGPSEAPKTHYKL